MRGHASKCIAVVGPRGRQRPVVHPHGSTDLVISNVLSAQAFRRPGGANGLHRRLERRRRKNPRVRCGPKQPILYRADPPAQRRQVQRLDRCPHRSHPGVRRNRSIQVKLPELDLLALRHQDPTYSLLGELHVAGIRHTRMCSSANAPPRPHRNFLTAFEHLRLPFLLGSGCGAGSRR